MSTDAGIVIAHCNTCGHDNVVPSRYAGKSGKCGKCKASVKVPDPKELIPPAISVLTEPETQLAWTSEPEVAWEKIGDVAKDAPQVIDEDDDDAVISSSQSLNEELDPVSMEDLQEGIEEDRVGVHRDASLDDVWKILNAILAQLKMSSGKGRGGELHQYKVITQKDKWFSGKFDPEKVEGVVNSYAKQGWTFKGVATASIPGFGGPRDEIVIIMER